MTVFADTYDTAVLDGQTAFVSQIDDDLRQLKRALQERLNVDHMAQLVATQLSDADTGKHRKVTFYGVLAVKPALDAGECAFYTKTVSGKSEIFFENEDGTECQLTNAGKLNVLATSIPNDTITQAHIRLAYDSYLQALNEAGDAEVGLIKSGRNEADDTDVAVLPDKVRTATSAAPAEDTQVANKKYVDDHVKKYDSGWFAATPNTTYTKLHGLGAVPTIVQVLYSNTADGSGDVVPVQNATAVTYLSVNSAFCDLDATNVVVRTYQNLAYYVDSAGVTQTRTTGWLKVVAVLIQ